MANKKTQIRHIIYHTPNTEAPVSVSSRGKIFDWKGRLLKPYRNRNPYLYVHAYSPTLKKTISVNVARAVLMAF